MKKSSKKKKIVFITFSNLKSASSGESVNDKKLFEAIPIDYQKKFIYPNYLKNDFLSIPDLLEFLIKYFKVINSSNIILITRGIKLSVFPLILKRFFRKKIIINLGCSPLWLVERKAWESNPEYKSNKNIFQKIYHIIEPYIERYALRNADKFIVENIKAKKIIEKYGANKNNIIIIPYYVQDYFMTGENADFKNQKETFKLGYTGRFRGYDLIEPIIKAIHLIIHEFPNIKLYLIGDGPKKEKIQNLVNLNNLSKNIIFLGLKSHKQVSKIVDQFHSLILPMLNNLCPSTISIKILEGVMKGKIIITTNSGNNKSLFLNNTDLIIEQNSSYEISEKIKLVIKNYYDYKNIAENLSNFHRKRRSKEIYCKRIKYLIENLN